MKKKLIPISFSILYYIKICFVIVVIFDCPKYCISMCGIEATK